MADSAGLALASMWLRIASSERANVGAPAWSPRIRVLEFRAPVEECDVLWLAGGENLETLGVSPVRGGGCSFALRKVLGELHFVDACLVCTVPLLEPRLPGSTGNYLYDSVLLLAGKLGVAFADVLPVLDDLGCDLAGTHGRALLAAVGDDCGRHFAVSVVAVPDGGDDDLIVV